MARYYDTLGGNSRGFVANGSLHVDQETGAMTTSSTNVRVNGQEVDMSGENVGAVREIEGWVLERLPSGLRVTDTYGTDPSR